MKNSLSNRIFIDLHYLKNLNKGFGQFCLNLAKNIPLHPVDDLSITYYAPHKWRNSFGKKIKYKSTLDWHRYTGIKNNYDLWHSVTHLSKVVPYRKKETKIIYTIHDAIFSIFDRPNQATKDQYRNLQSKIDESSSLVYISEFTKKNIQEKFNIPSHVKQYVIYNGAPPISSDVKGKQHSSPYLLCIGEFRGYKNQKALIPMLNFMDKEIKVVFVGKCSRKQQEIISSIAKKYQVQDRVIIKGTVPENEKAELLNNANALVHPSLAEGFGLPVVEAMSYGTPVIISNNTSLPEVGGEVANYWDNFDPEYMAGVVNSALEEFDDNPILRTQELKAQASKFTWKKAAKEYIQVYKDLI